MRKKRDQTGRQEMRAFLRQYRGHIAIAGVFSLAANLLMLSGPIYMMQVYDRVLTYRATETLIALTVILAFLFGILAVLDMCRARVMARIAARFGMAAEARVFAARITDEARQAATESPDALQDLAAVQRFIGSPGMIALLDLPWTPIFLGAFFILHPALGWLAVASAALLMMLSVLGHLLTGGTSRRARAASRTRAQFLADGQNEADVLWAMGRIGNLHEHWRAERREAVRADVALQDVQGGFAALGRALRLFLQSAMLGLGAWLTIQGELGAGAMLAASVMLGRALAPFEAMSGHWPSLHRARQGWANLAVLLDRVPPMLRVPEPTMEKAALSVQNITLAPPGARRAALSGIAFDLGPGEALAVIGPSGSGKSVLARAILGIWPSVGGRIMLGGMDIAHFGSGNRTGVIGYLPQTVGLLEGTIAQNIAGFDAAPDRDQTIAAARAAAAHQCIQVLSEGYETTLADSRKRLSSGELQRIGLARALYGDPVLLVLDAPNANLDSEGSQALNAAVRAVKARGGMAVIMANRPTAIQECDHLLVLDQGRMRAMGPKAEVLEQLVRNADGITLAAARRGAA